MSASPSTQFEAHCDGGGTPTVYVSGEVDLSTRDRLATVLTRAMRPGSDLVVDCTRMSFIDASGVSTLVRSAQEVSGGRLRLKGAHGYLSLIIDLLDLTSIQPNLVIE